MLCPGSSQDVQTPSEGEGAQPGLHGWSEHCLAVYLGTQREELSFPHVFFISLSIGGNDTM